MDATTLLTISASLVAALFGVLCAVIGWVGSRVVVKQDELMAKLDLVKDDLHTRINHLGIRLVKVETKVGGDENFGRR